jgi:Kef-type K+ transport system membrane component KefB
MEGTAKTFITLGVLLLLGLITDAIGRRTRLPRVTLLLVFGFLIGPTGIGFLNPDDEKWFSLVSDMALVMIGFLLGEKLVLSSLRQHGKFVLWLSGAEVIATVLVVLVGLLGAAYIMFRVLGRLLGAWTGGVMNHADHLLGRRMGMELMPQAGVALGMALVATHHRPDRWGDHACRHWFNGAFRGDWPSADSGWAPSCR